MTTYTQILYHIVLITKGHSNCLTSPNDEKLYGIIWSIISKYKCHPYAINGVENHIHIATHMHPAICASELVKHIKLGASAVIKAENLFPKFTGWQVGFGAFSFGIKDKDRVVKYVLNQKQRHGQIDLKDEYKTLIEEAKIQMDPKYFFNDDSDKNA